MNQYPESPPTPSQDTVNRILEWYREFLRHMELMHGPLGSGDPSEFDKVYFEMNALRGCVAAMKALTPEAIVIWERFDKFVGTLDELVENGTRLTTEADLALTNPSEYRSIVKKNRELGAKGDSEFSIAVRKASKWLGVQLPIES